MSNYSPSVHLCLGELDVGSNVVGDGVVGIDDPEAFPFVPLPSKESASAAHESFESLGEVSGMEDDQTHAFQQAHLDGIAGESRTFP